MDEREATRQCPSTGNAPENGSRCATFLSPKGSEVCPAPSPGSPGLMADAGVMSAGSHRVQAGKRLAKPATREGRWGSRKPGSAVSHVGTEAIGASPSCHRPEERGRPSFAESIRMMLKRGKNKALENMAGEKTPSLNPSGCYLPEAE